MLPPGVLARVAVEQGSVIGWDRYAGSAGTIIGMHTFGSSAPIKELQTKFGFTPEKVLQAARDQIAKHQNKHQIQAPDPSTRPSTSPQASRPGPALRAGAKARVGWLISRAGDRPHDRSRPTTLRGIDMNALKALHTEQDQAVWLDFVARGFIAKGELEALVENDGLRGVTSNPSIFEKAIGHSDEYDASLKSVMEQGDSRVIDLYEGLAIADIQAAADVLRPVYEASDGADGYVSLEVSPYLALQTEETLEEARRLHKAVGRDNLMVKVPATPEGIPAIRQLTAEGISINVTLLFSQDEYEKVARAFIDGLEERAKNGGDVSRIASVASFFISRIDVLADKLLDEKIAAAKAIPTRRRLSKRLKGKVAIANAKLAYQRYKAVFGGKPKWTALAEKGAKAQRLLWASTGTKNKAYRDVLYVEELIGPNTVNTMPPATMDAFRDHGAVRNAIEEDVAGAEAVMAEPRQGRDRHRRAGQAAGRGGRATLHRRRRQAARRGRRPSAWPCSAIGSTARASSSARRWRPRPARRSSPGARAARSAGSGRTTRRSGRAPTRTSGSAGCASSRTSSTTPTPTPRSRPG